MLNETKYSVYFKCLKLTCAFIIAIKLAPVTYANAHNNNQNSYPFNSPYLYTESVKNTLFSHYDEQPKHLDPARSYSAPEQVFIAQIYEPPYQYNYLIRPYKLEPLSAAEEIQVEYYDHQNKKLPDTASYKQIEYSLYTVKIKPEIYFQPHPSFTKNISDNKFIYQDLNKKFINKLTTISDFNLNIKNTTSTRELVAQDFIYGIKRLSDPKVESPIYGFMSKYIYNLEDLNKLLQTDDKAQKYINLNDARYDIEGLRLIDKYTYQIKIKGRYPQFIYWFAMNFFAPIAWEVDKFYSQEGLAAQNMSIDTYPVGTGPFMMTVNKPNQQIILEKNPNYNLKTPQGIYPSTGMPDDQKKGLLDKAGQKMPFIDKAIFNLEKESIPVWNKFLQGYYDGAGISSDNFNQAISVVDNTYNLSKQMQDRGIKLIRSMEPSVFYWGFNMLDPVVGGYKEQQKKLRQAISIVFNVEEYINIFLNGRGQAAHDPIPPVIMSDSDKDPVFNPHIYQDKKTKKSLEVAKQYLAEAGYPNGIDKKTGEQLILHFDAIMTGDADQNALFNWLREQFQALNINLDIRATQYNRFQEKMRLGNEQIFFWGWSADYPDPENFLFLFLCKQGKVHDNGENAANYCNKKFDDLFQQMQDSNDQASKNKIINQMIKILRDDSPWIFGLFTESYILQHAWNEPTKPLTIGNNNLKYKSISPSIRVDYQIKNNQPIIWPLFILVLLSGLVILPIVISYYRKNHRPPKRI